MMADRYCRKCNKTILKRHIPYCSKCEKEILIEDAARRKKITIAFTIFIIVLGFLVYSRFLQT